MPKIETPIHKTSSQNNLNEFPLQANVCFLKGSKKHIRISRFLAQNGSGTKSKWAKTSEHVEVVLLVELYPAGSENICLRIPIPFI